MAAPFPVDTRALRRELRAKRRALRPAQQTAAARRLCRRLGRHPAFLKASAVALYSAADGEIDPAPLRRLAHALGKQVYLPVLHPLYRDRMIFVACGESERLLPNRFGIPEPARMTQTARPWQLGLVLMPLVAFDPAGNRLGMGGGFYDRTFELARQARWPRRPLLCGLAHRLQRVDALPANAWDVPLRRVFTD